MEKANKEILIIDDSETNVFLLESVLHEYGYKVTSSFNAQDALKLVEKKNFDLILLDLLMPEVSGFDFARDLKKDKRLQSIPIIVVSALSDEKSVKEIKDIGITEYFEKPVVLTSLVQRIDSILLG